MSTPIKSASTFLLNARHISPRSPRLLAPLEHKNLFSPSKTTAKPSFNFTKETNVVKNNTIQIKIIEERNCEDSLLIDSPHKLHLLNYGLSKYDLLFLLGRGSFGTVIKGNYKGNIVAVKLIKLDKHNDQVNEINALHLVHENIIRTFDVIVSQKYALIMMEYHKNSKNLQSILDDNNILLDRKTIVKFCKDVTNGLKYCHKKGVLHLDMKPKNILVCNNETCKICDFGNSVYESNSTEKFRYQGSVAYAAPEILKGKKPSTKSDIYSLAILIWQMMTRKCPYELLDSEVVVKFNHRPSLDSKEDFLASLCRMCWDEIPNKRPSAAQLYDLLNNNFK